VCETVRESFRNREWASPKRQLVTNSGGAGGGLSKKLRGVDEAAVHDVTASIAGDSCSRSGSTCNQARDADSKQTERRSHDIPATTNTTASISSVQHRMTASSERYGLDDDGVYTDLNNDNGDVLLMNFSISSILCNGEDIEAATELLTWSEQYVRRQRPEHESSGCPDGSSSGSA
jgi:hypothetical protein